MIDMGNDCHVPDFLNLHLYYFILTHKVKYFQRIITLLLFKIYSDINNDLNFGE